MSSNEVPEPWRTRLIQRNFVDPRYTDDRPSLRRLGAEIGVHPTTISNAISGRSRASEETIARLVDALGDDVAGWLGRQAPREWTPPAESALLTDRQRKAVEELIKSMTERQEQANGSQAQGTPITRAAGSAAHEHDVEDAPAPPTENDYGLAAKRAPRERAFDDQSEAGEQ